MLTFTAGKLVTSIAEGQRGHVPILVVNPLPTDVTLYKGTRVAKAGPVESLMVAPVSESIQGIAPEVSPPKSIMLQEMVER